MPLRIQHYFRLMRLDKPIGILLLLWPTLWALWLAARGLPDVKVLAVFVAGVVFMRSAGCVVNDIADRHFDAHVERTRTRPLAAQQVTVGEALVLAFLLLGAAFCLVLLCNTFTIQLAFLGAALAVVYPLLKRITYLPQLGLGAAFAWGVPMAFAAETGSVDGCGWLFLTSVIWPVIYDTMYAMADRKDDITIGVKSTAILFGQRDKKMIALLQLVFLVMLVITGMLFKLHTPYYLALLAVGFLFIYQQYLIKERDPRKCLAAFLNNQWAGCIIFAGIICAL